MKSIYRSFLVLGSIPLSALAIAGAALQSPSAQAITPAAELCLKISKSRIVTPKDMSACQEKISQSSFDPGAVGVCSAMIDLRISTVSQIHSCIDAIRNKTYPNGTEVCLMMFNSFATPSAITACLANSGQPSTVAPVVGSRQIESEESKSIDRAIARIDAAIFQIDSDGANAAHVYAIEQLLIAKNELLKLKKRL